MIYSDRTFQDCYSAVFPLQAYFLPNYGNGEAPVLGKLPFQKNLYPKLGDLFFN
jgi:hypothetical protein